VHSRKTEPLPHTGRMVVGAPSRVDPGLAIGHEPIQSERHRAAHPRRTRPLMISRAVLEPSRARAYEEGLLRLPVGAHHISAARKPDSGLMLLPESMRGEGSAIKPVPTKAEFVRRPSPIRSARMSLPETLPDAFPGTSITVLETDFVLLSHRSMEGDLLPRPSGRRSVSPPGPFHKQSRSRSPSPRTSQSVAFVAGSSSLASLGEPDFPTGATHAARQSIAPFEFDE
jgi:hypothetical protein